LESEKERYHYEDLELRGEDNIKIDLREKWSGTDGIYLTQDRDQYRARVNTVMNHGRTVLSR
jgi:hypothetical protein